MVLFIPLFTDGQNDLDSLIEICKNTGGFVGNNSLIGRSIDVIGDLNDDGYDDIIVGEPGNDDGGTDRGAVWILFMDANQNVSSEQRISDTQGDFTAALDNKDQFGIGVAGIGDLNGDGIEDVAVGAFSDDDGATNRGAVYILFLGTDGKVDDYQKISSSQGNFSGLTGTYVSFGWDVDAFEDFNNDGINDLLAGALGDDDGGLDKGAAYILLLDTNGQLISSSPNYYKINESVGNFSFNLDNEDYFGNAIENMGDLDGNGVPDMAVAARLDDDGHTNAGAVYVLYMNSSGTVDSTIKFSDNTSELTSKIDASDNFGIAMAAGDIDGITGKELLIGSHTDDYTGLTDAGSIYYLKINNYSLDTVELWNAGYLGSGVLAASDFFGRCVSFYQEYSLGELVVIGGAGGDDCGGTNYGKFYFMDFSDPNYSPSYDTLSEFLSNSRITGFYSNSKIINIGYNSRYPGQIFQYSLFDHNGNLVAGVNADGSKATINSPTPPLSIGYNEISLDFSNLSLTVNTTYRIEIFQDGRLEQEVNFKYNPN